MSGKKHRQPDPFLRVIGQRIRLRREAKGLLPAELAFLLGQTTKHVEACEAGQKKFGLRRLCRIARALEVPVGYFLDDPVPAPVPPLASPVLPREALPLLRAFLALPDARLRQQALDYVQALPSSDSRNTPSA